MSNLRKSWNVVMVLVGVAGLLLKGWLSGSMGEVAYSYLGNLSASFSVYFLVSLGAQPRLRRIAIAAIALLVVEAFELADGFGIMTNVYDPMDLLANAVGVVLAYGVDTVSVRIIPSDSGGH